MNRGPRRNHSSALAALKDDRTMADLSEQFDVHPNQIAQWKKQLLEHAAEAFGDTVRSAPPIDLKALHAKLGELTHGECFYLELLHDRYRTRFNFLDESLLSVEMRWRLCSKHARMSGSEGLDSGPAQVNQSLKIVAGSHQRHRKAHRA